MSESVTLDDVAASVKQLSDAVTEMQAGLVDRETVENIATELLEQQKATLPEQNRRHGFQPDDSAPAIDVQGLLSEGLHPLHAMQSLPAKEIAPILRRSEADVIAYQRAADTVAILNALCTEGQSKILPRDVRETAFFQKRFKPLMQAMDTGTAGEGLEFVPRDLSASLIERISLDLLVAPLFPQIEMPSNPFDIPAKSVGRQRLGKHAEQTADTGQTGFKKVTPGSRKVTLTAVRFAGEALVSRDETEDAIIAIMPFLEEELVEYLGADFEDSILNGDTTGPHQDSDTTAADDPRKNFIGLRKLALAAAKTDVGNVAPTALNSVRVNRKKMGKYGVRPRDLAHLMSINAFIQFLADTNVLTMDKYGPMATVVTGELAKVDGSPIVVSEYVRADLNATGVHDGVTTNRTEILTVNQRGYVVGERRGLTLQVLRELYAEFDQDAILCNWRKAFSARFTSTTEPTVAVAYNVAS